MAEISFKSVGIKNTDPILSQDIDPPPIGIMTPLRLSTKREGPFEMHYVLANQVNDNLRNLVMTNYGERVGRYNFGANLRPLLFELTNKEDFDQEAMLRIKNACNKFMPFVELDTFDSTIKSLNSSEPVPDGLAKIVITLKYSIPKLRVSQRVIEITLFAGG